MNPRGVAACFALRRTSVCGAADRAERARRAIMMRRPVLTFRRVLKILWLKQQEPVGKRRFSGEDTMPTSRRTLLRNSAAAAAVVSLDWTRARAEAETVRIGVIYDLTGPFAAAGSVAVSIGTQIVYVLVISEV